MGEQPSEKTVDDELLPSGSAQPARKFRLSGRVLALALAVNLVLVLVFAGMMALDKPKPPKEVYYINLVDTPAEPAPDSLNTDAAGQ